MATQQEIRDRLGEMGVVSILVIENVEDALRVGEALSNAALSAMEITFRTEAAAEGIDKLVREFPEALVGAGTVLTVENLAAARDAGAQFVVTPGLNPTVVEKALEIGMPIYPGVMTPSDIEKGLSLGLEVLKYFPAGNAGGVPMLKALSGPYRHTGVQFIPTGGINGGNVIEYLSLPVVLACGGTWIAKSDLIKAKDWAGIERVARETVEAIRESRQSGKG
jgi:2-dehydro-3-deoxyphosphogluconate aldolase/(4S)-4-hydroxy-2-oxoglutarate aldolase